MGAIASPDIRRDLFRDIYTHITTIPDPEHETEWSDDQVYNVKSGGRFFVNDFVAELKGFDKLEEVQGVTLGPNDVAIKANIVIQGKYRDYRAEPMYIIKDNFLGTPPFIIDDLGVKITFAQVDPQTNTFTFVANTSQKDYIIMKAMEKPLINILWIGTLLLVLGLTIAMRRRIREFKKGKVK